MGPIDANALPAGSLWVVDSAPIIYTLEGSRLAARFAPVFARHAAGEIRFAITTVALAEVLTGPLAAGEEALARRYRAALESWQVVPLTTDIAELAARLRGVYRLKLADAVQAASALAIGAAGLVTHDRDFSRLRDLAVL